MCSVCSLRPVIITRPVIVEIYCRFWSAEEACNVLCAKFKLKGLETSPIHKPGPCLLGFERALLVTSVRPPPTGLLPANALCSPLSC